jgi:hypothetical protein
LYLQKFQIIEEIQGITQDMQSAVTTMDGKYLLIVTGGFQRFASGVFVLVSVLCAVSNAVFFGAFCVMSCDSGCGKTLSRGVEAIRDQAFA